MDNTTYRSLLHHIQSLLVVDTHEHMATEADFIEGTWDFTHLMSYTGLDLGLAGMSSEPWGGTQSAISQGDSPEEKWERMAPYWPHVRSGCYARAYRRFLQRFFGVDDLNERTAVEVSERISDYQYEGVYDKHLHGEDNIRVMLHMGGCGPHPEPQHFASILYLDSHAGPLTRGELEGSLGREAPATYAEYADALGGIADTAVSNGAVGMKIGMTARRRPLDFVEHDAAEVEASYRYLLEEADGEWLDPAVQARLKPFQDAAYWVMFGKAGEHGLPIQVHSGLEFMQPWDGRPTCLIPSLVRFPETKFAIFHGSYPHMADLTGLAKSFSNVYLDLAWFHLLSRFEARRWMTEWLDVLPHNKIFAFGGDVMLFFGACSHLAIAQENVAAVLTERIEDELCSIDEAEQLAQLLFHDNAWNAFRMENWPGAGEA